MGCGHSKLEPNEDLPARLRPSPVGRRWFHIRKNEAAGAGRNRKGCRFVTPSELMQKEDSEAGDIAAVEQLQAAENGAKTEKTAKEGEMRPVGEEELPGSPSFRFYFAEGAPLPKWMKNGADVVASENVEKDQATLQEDNVHRREDSLNSATLSEESEYKSTKKDKRSKFKVLAKGSSVMYNTLLGR